MVNTLARIISTNYAVLLPTVDIALALVTTLPLYTTQLFVRQLAAGNLINAIGYPLAATVGLGTIDSGRRGIAHPPRGGLGHRSKHRGPRHLTDSRRHRRPPTTVYRPRQ
ncbi:PE family protein [Mycobacterium tuberculosis]|uniref:PE family protein n=1 Tax=Mycobacterium tuberculosis TaxID=1773 RepID=A0A655JNM0_MYCTX|nr:PE family protein [Mycobacterium tuberculosis]